VSQLQPQFIQQLDLNDPDWQQLCQTLKTSTTLAAIVLSAWQMALWLAKLIVEQQLTERAQVTTSWSSCPVCGTPLVSKGFVKRQILTLVGQVEWKRRVGRCPHRCSGSQSIPFDHLLEVHSYQQTSTELRRLGCLLAVFLPFELTAWMLQQFSGIQVSDDAIWNWVQAAGQQAAENLKLQLQQLGKEQSIQTERLDASLLTMPLIIAADGVTVPFRPQPKTTAGRIVWREVKVALLARFGNHQTKTGETKTRLYHRRVVASLGDIDRLKPRLQLEALRQGMTTASQVVWISDGARGFWRLYRECFAPKGAVGILDFYHAAQHLWQAASAYQDGKESPNSSAVVCQLMSSIAPRFRQRHYQRIKLVEQV